MLLGRLVPWQQQKNLFQFYLLVILMGEVGIGRGNQKAETEIDQVSHHSWESILLSHLLITFQHSISLLNNSYYDLIFTFINDWFYFHKS